MINSIDVEIKTRVFKLDHAVAQYFATMSEVELKILDLAREQLGSSFDIEKSIGFLDYLKENNIVIEK
jgi:hypothetical protein|tara:strand:- start:164 stop:367 length:204 start_codon:yes stop_codon:yes gene_type:complete